MFELHFSCHVKPVTRHFHLSTPGSLSNREFKTQVFRLFENFQSITEKLTLKD